MVHVRTVHRFSFQLDLSLLLMLAMLLWIAGGASRADVMGQVIVRRRVEAPCHAPPVLAQLGFPAGKFHACPIPEGDPPFAIGRVDGNGQGIERCVARMAGRPERVDRLVEIALGLPRFKHWKHARNS